jgi:hypothetical protein
METKDSDKPHADADALHREDLAQAAEQRQALAAVQSEQIMELIRLNTELTQMTKTLSERIETITSDVHRRLTAQG